MIGAGAQSPSRSVWWRRDQLPPEGPGAAGRPPASRYQLAFRALIAFSLFLLLAPQALVPALASLRLAWLSGMVAIVACVVSRVRRGGTLFPHRREALVAGGLLSWAALTIPFSLWPGGSLDALTSVFVKSLAVFWLVGTTVNALARLRRLAAIMSVVSGILATIGIRNYLSGKFMSPDGFVMQRIQGYDAPLTENPNDLALLLNMILPITLGLLLGARRAGYRVILLGVLALNLVAIVFTFSRQGFVALAVTFALYEWKLLRRRPRTWAIAGLAVVVLGVFLLPGAYLQRIGTITDIEADPTGSAEARWTDALAAVTWVGRNPIVGAGLDQGTLALNEVRGSTWKVVHNAYLQYAVDLGLPGVTLFVTLLVLCIRAARRAQRRSPGATRPDVLFLLGEGIEVSLITFAISVFFAPVAYNFFFYYFGGLALAARGVRDLSLPPVPGPAPVREGVGPAVAFLSPGSARPRPVGRSAT